MNPYEDPEETAWQARAKELDELIEELRELRNECERRMCVVGRRMNFLKYWLIIHFALLVLSKSLPSIHIKLALGIAVLLSWLLLPVVAVWLLREWLIIRRMERRTKNPLP